MTHSDTTLSALEMLLKSRRTVNFFTDQPVDHKLIEAAVDAARWVPNHRLTEPWQFFHLGPECRDAIIELAVQLAREHKGEQAAVARRERLNAVPEWLAVTATIAEDELLDREDYAAACCAVQNLLLFLWQAGVGSKWTTGAVTRLPETLNLLGLDQATHRVVGLIWMGYPRQPSESVRRPLDEVFFRLP